MKTIYFIYMYIESVNKFTINIYNYYYNVQIIYTNNLLHKS